MIQFNGKAAQFMATESTHCSLLARKDLSFLSLIKNEPFGTLASQKIFTFTIHCLITLKNIQSDTNSTHFLLHCTQFVRWL